MQRYEIFFKMTIIYSKKLARYMTKEYIFVKKRHFFYFYYILYGIKVVSLPNNE